MLNIKVYENEYNRIVNKEQKYVYMINNNYDMEVGDYILFKKRPELFEGVLVKICDKKIYKTFLEMTTIHSLKDLGLDCKNNLEGSNLCLQKYSKQDEEKYGVVVYRFDLVNR